MYIYLLKLNMISNVKLQRAFISVFAYLPRNLNIYSIKCARPSQGKHTHTQTHICRQTHTYTYADMRTDTHTRRYTHGLQAIEQLRHS